MAKLIYYRLGKHGLERLLWFYELKGREIRVTLISCEVLVCLWYQVAGVDKSQNHLLEIGAQRAKDAETRLTPFPKSTSAGM